MKDVEMRQIVESCHFYNLVENCENLTFLITSGVFYHLYCLQKQSRKVVTKVSMLCLFDFISALLEIENLRTEHVCCDWHDKPAVWRNHPKKIIEERIFSTLYRIPAWRCSVCFVLFFKVLDFVRLCNKVVLVIMKWSNIFFPNNYLNKNSAFGTSKEFEGKIFLIKNLKFWANCHTYVQIIKW